MQKYKNEVALGEDDIVMYKKCFTMTSEKQCRIDNGVKWVQNGIFCYSSARYIKKCSWCTYKARKKFFESALQKTFDAEINLKENMIKLRQSTEDNWKLENF